MPEQWNIPQVLASLPSADYLNYGYLRENPVEIPIERNENEEIMGNLSEYERLAYSALRNLTEMRDRALLDIRFASTDQSRQEIAEAYERHVDSEKILRFVLWVSVKERLGLWREPSIGLRSGWEIVRANPSAEEILIQSILQR